MQRSVLWRPLRSLPLFFLLFCFNSSCSRSLEVRSEYLRPDYLAAEQVDTPDPCRGCYQGQQIIVHWALPTKKVREIALTVRYGDREMRTFCHSIQKKRGYWITQLLNEEYWNRQGIISYKVEIYEDGKLLAHKEHHLWSEIISLSEREKPEVQVM